MFVGEWAPTAGDLEHRDSEFAKQQVASGPTPKAWTVVIPFFNEREWLPEAIASLSRQSLPFELILVDNGSTDGSAAIAQAECERHRLEYSLLFERRRGKVAALATGLKQVRTRFVATCDADTWYPPNYLQAATALLQETGCAAAGAFYAERNAPPRTRLLRGLHVLLAGWLFPRQCHAGGAGQVFETAALRRAGSYDPERWNLVLEDHEIMNRVLKERRVAYALDFWSAPSGRHRDRDSVRWTLFERIVYHAVGSHAGDWYFEHFLAPRLRARRLSSERLRERNYLRLEIDDASPHAVC